MPVPIRKDKSLADQLKGVSILAVIGLHLLTFVPPENVFQTPTGLLFISVNQALRFYVPV